MILQPISTLPEPTKVISLTAARDKYRPGKCRHLHMTVDDELDTVSCDDCGEDRSIHAATSPEADGQMKKD